MNNEYADKRSVSTDALETLGMIIGPNEKRDAIHLAVDPAVAAVKLYPGQDVGFVEGGVGPCDNPVGIVDPFLQAPVQPGERFWLVVYPRQITSLRHVWSHPLFQDELGTEAPVRDKAASEEWLRRFIARSDCPDYDTVIETALNNRNTWDPEYLHFDGRDAHGDIPPEFWEHLQVVTGVEIPSDRRAKYFSCSC